MSWRKYGGINQLNSQNFINVNSIATDHISFRGQYEGYFDVCGEIHATGNIVTDSNSIVLGDEHIYHNLLVDCDTDIYGNTVSHGKFFAEDKIYIGTGIDLSLGYVSDQSKNYLYGNSTGIGINNINPTAVLDIEGGSKHLLNIKSTNTENVNIIAQNVNNKGISVSATDISSGFSFYNDASINDLGYYGASIYYTHNTDSLVIDISNDLRVVSGMIVTKHKNEVDTIDHIGNETVSIFNNTSGPYLYNLYKDNTIQTGTALSLISIDNSSNTFLNVINPNNVGMGIGGGSYTSDNTRSFGTMGVLDISGNYTASQTIVSGKDRTRNPTTLGINSYVPNTDNYVIDINGPTHMENNMITSTLLPNFEILQMKFCKNDNKYGYIVGSPSDYNKNANSNIYPHLSYKTVDGGKNWNTINIFDISGELTNTYINLTDIFVYDSNYAFTVGNSPLDNTNGAFYYTYDGGNTWKAIIVDPSRSSVNVTKISFTGISIVDSGTSKLAFLSSNDQIPSSTSVNGLYYYLDITKLFIQHDINVLSFYTSPTGNLLGNSIDTYFKDGFQLIFIVGNGGFKVYDANNNGGNYELYAPNINNADSLATPNTLYGYNGDGGVADTYYYNYSTIKVYDLSHILISGYNKNTNKNVITCVDSITNSKNWRDIVFNVKINDIYIYDISNAIAVGDNGNLFYTIDGYKTWININMNDYNPYKNSLLKNNSNYNLTKVFIYDLNSIVISKAIKRFDTAQSTLGLSETLFAYLPTVFNNDNNNVLDICGNMSITGDVKTNKKTIKLLNETANTIYFGNEANQIYLTTPNTTGNTYIQSNLDVSGFSTFRNNMNFLKDATAFGNLYVKGNTIMYDNLYANKNIILSRDISMIGNIYTDNNAVIRGNLTVYKDIIFYGHFNIGSETNLLGNLYVDKSTYINANLYVNGNTTGNGLLTNNNDVIFNGNLYVNNDISLNHNLYVVNDTKLNGNLYVNNDTSLNGMLNVFKDTNLQGNLRVSNNSIFDGDVLFNKHIGIGNDLQIGNNLAVHGNLYVDKNITTASNLNIGNDSKIQGNLYVKGYVSQFTNNVSIDNNLVVNNNMVVVGEGNFPSIANMGNANVNNIMSINGISGELRCSVYRPSYDEFTKNWYTDAYFLSDNQISKNIYLGGETDQIFIRGNLQIKGESNVNIAALTFSDSKVWYLNSISYEGLNGVIHSGTNLNYGSSQGSGIAMYDYGNASAAYIVISQDQLGYILKSSGYNDLISPITNRIKLDLQKMSTKSNQSEIVSITPAPSIKDYYSPNGSGIDFDYSVTSCGIKTGEIFLRDISLSNSTIQTISTDVQIPNNTLFANNIDVCYNLTVSGDVYVTGNTFLTNPYSRLVIDNIVNINGPIYSNDTLYVNKIVLPGLNVGGSPDVPIEFNKILVLETLSLGGKLYANADATINGILTTNSDTNVHGNLKVSKSVFLNNIDTSGSVNIGNTLHVANATTLDDSLNVGSDAKIKGMLNVLQNTYLSTLDVSYATNIYGELNVYSGTLLNDNVICSKKINIGSDAAVSGNCLVGGNFFVGNLLNISGSLILANNASINGKLNINNDLSINGISRIYNNINQFLPGNNIQFGVYNLNQTTGVNNSAYGYTSLYNNTTGSYNSAFGYNTLYNNTTGSSNTVFGNVALLNNTTGSNNVAIGTFSGNSNITGNNNTFLGFNSDSSGNFSNSTAIGYNSKIYGDNLIIMGTPLEKTVFLGDASFNGNLVINKDISIGGNLNVNKKLSILNISGENVYSNFLNSTIVGNIGSVTSGNIFIKNFYVGSDNSGLITLNGYFNQNFGSRNVQYGGNKSFSKIFTTTATTTLGSAATDNVAFGLNILENLTVGDFNIGIGNYSLQNSDNNSRNIGLGYQTLNKLYDSNDNIAIGYNSLKDYTGDSIINGVIQTNIFGGINAGSNVAIGSLTGQNMIVGQYNTMIGTLSCGNNTNTTKNFGVANTLIGYGTDMNDSYSYSTAIGRNAIITNNHQIVLGTSEEYVIIKSTTPSTTYTNGSLVIAGGLGVAGSINIGGSLGAQILSVTSTNPSTSISTGALVVPGGIGIGGGINVLGSINTSGIVNIGNGSTSQTTSTGALVVNGGVGIGENLFVNKILDANSIVVNSTIESLSKNSGSVQIRGGAGILKSLFVGGSVVSDGLIATNSSTPSTTTTNGALIVNGGAGIGGDVNIGGSMNIKGSIIINNTNYGSSNAALVVAGGAAFALPCVFNDSIRINGAIYSSGFVRIDDYTASTTTSSGALRVKGGAGIGGDVNIAGYINAGGPININNTTEVDLINTTGSLNIIGGANIKKSLLIGNKLYANSIYINGTIDSISTTDGALVVPGGLGMGKTLNVGGNINSSGIVKIMGTSNSITSSTGSLVIAGGVGIGGSMNIDGSIKINNTDYGSSNAALVVAGGAEFALPCTFNNLIQVNGAIYSSGFIRIDDYTASTTTSSGALRVNGGAGIGGDVNIAGYINAGGIVAVGSTTKSTTITNGALIVSGGAGVGGNMNIGGSINSVGDVKIQSSTISITTTNGALIVSGGAGIGGSVNIGDSINVTGSATFKNKIIQNYGSSNLHFGSSDSLPNINSSITSNITFGISCLTSFTNGTLNIAIGNNAINKLTNGNNNIALGSGSLFTLDNLSSTNGYADSNIAIGTNSLYLLNTNGNNSSYNVAVGKSVGSNVSNGQYNTFIGSKILANGTNVISNYNTFLGSNINYDSSVTNTSYSTAIGYGSKITASNQIVLGTNSEYVICSGTIPSLNTTTGSIIINGGAGISGNMNIGGSINVGSSVKIQSSTNSTTTTNGALIVSGGAGIGGSVNIGGSTNVTGSATFNNKIIQNYGNSNLHFGSSDSLPNINSSTISNIAFGISCLPNFINGVQNIAIGNNAINKLINGNNNIALGAGSLYTLNNSNSANDYSDCNVAIGTNSLNKLDTSSTNNSSYNVAIGKDAGKSVYNGKFNTFVGSLTGNTYTNTSSNYNTFLGSNTDYGTNVTTAGFNNSTAIGYGARITASNQIVLGTNSEYVVCSGTTNSTNASTGAFVVKGGVGIGGSTNVTGSATFNNQIIQNYGNSNLHFGSSDSLPNINSSTISNIAFGISCLPNFINGAQNIAIGNNAINKLINGNNNIALGAGSLYTLNNSNSANDYSDCNVAIGTNSLNKLDTSSTNNSSYNVAIGKDAGKSVYNGKFNTFVGSLTGNTYTNTSSNYNTFLGSNTDYGTNVTTAGFNNSTAIGYGARITASNQIVLGTNSEYIVCNGTTDSTNASTGALVVKGGVGIQGVLNVSGQIIALGGLVTPLGTDYISKGPFKAYGLITGYAGVNISDTVSSLPSISSTTGALTITGGAGINGPLNIGGSINSTGIVNIANSSVSSSANNGSLIVAGGVGISGALNIGGSIRSTGIVNISNSSVSSSANSGSLIVAGGVGIGGALNIGGSISSTGVVYISNTTDVQKQLYSTYTLSSSLASTNAALYVAGGANIAGGLSITGSAGLYSTCAIIGSQGSNPSFYNQTITENDSTSQIANTQFVTSSVTKSKISPTFSGTPIAPDYSGTYINSDLSVTITSTTTSQIATTNFVNKRISNVLTNSPSLSGTPLAPDYGSTVTSQIATMGYINTLTTNNGLTYAPISAPQFRASGSTLPTSVDVNSTGNTALSPTSYSSIMTYQSLMNYGYASTSYVSTQLSSYASTSSVTTQLSSYVGKSQIISILTGGDATNNPNYLFLSGLSSTSSLTSLNNGYYHAMLGGNYTGFGNTNNANTRPAATSIDASQRAGLASKTTVTSLVYLNNDKTSDGYYKNFVIPSASAVLSTEIKQTTPASSLPDVTNNTGYLWITGGITTSNSYYGTGNLFPRDIPAANTIRTGTLYCDTLTGGTISGSSLALGSGSVGCGNITCGGITSTGAFSCGTTNSLTCGAITSYGAYTGGTYAVNCGPITSTGAFSCGTTNNLTCGNITCGTVNGLSITTGGTITGYAKTTSPSFSGTVNIGSATDFTTSTTTTTGSLVVYGGVGIGGSVNIGGSINTSSGITINSTDASFVIGNSTQKLTLQNNSIVANGVALTLNFGTGGTISNLNNINGTSIASFAKTSDIIPSASPSFTGTVNIGTTSNKVDTTSTNTGSLVVYGGVGIGGSVNVGGSIATTGIVKINASMASSTTSTGALIVTGGVGIGGSVYTSGTVSCNSVTTTYINGILATSYQTAAVSLSDYIRTTDANNNYATKTSISGLAALADPSFTGTVNIGTTAIKVATTSTNTGSLVVYGGVGIGGSVNVGGTVSCNSVTTTYINGILATSYQTAAVSLSDYIRTTDANNNYATKTSISGLAALADPSFTGTVNIGTTSNKVATTSTNTGSLVVYGGVGIGGSVNVGGSIATTGIVKINASMASSTTSTGALIVNGGVGIGGSVNVGGTVSCNSVTTTYINGILATSYQTAAVSLTGYAQLANPSFTGTVKIGTTASKVATTSTSTGSLVVYGGVGIGDSVNVGGDVGVDGDLTANSFNSNSDYRIKDNVKQLDDNFSVDNLKPITYINKNTKKQDIGFIAHEVQEEYPFLVEGEKDGETIQSLNYIGLIGILVKEIQYLKKEVSFLKTKI